MTATVTNAISTHPRKVSPAGVNCPINGSPVVLDNRAIRPLAALPGLAAGASTATVNDDAVVPAAAADDDRVPRLADDRHIVVAISTLDDDREWGDWIENVVAPFIRGPDVNGTFGAIARANAAFRMKHQGTMFGEGLGTHTALSRGRLNEALSRSAIANVRKGSLSAGPLRVGR